MGKKVFGFVLNKSSPGDKENQGIIEVCHLISLISRDLNLHIFIIYFNSQAKRQ
jgi:hypothetical protein